MAIVGQKGFLPAPKVSIVCVYIYISIVFWCCGFHVSCPVNKAPLTYRLKELNKTNKTNICICMCILYTYIYLYIYIYTYSQTYACSRWPLAHVPKPGKAQLCHRWEGVLRLSHLRGKAAVSFLQGWDSSVGRDPTTWFTGISILDQGSVQQLLVCYQSFENI